jgi:hypothetical protein
MVVKAAKRGIESEPGDLPFLHDYVVERCVNQVCHTDDNGRTDGRTVGRWPLGHP